MLLKKEESCLLLIDIQEKLTPHVFQAGQLVKHCAWLMRLANQLQIPQIVSEQYPKGLGKTVESLSTLSSYPCIEKVTFSCWQEPTFQEKIQTLGKRQLVLIGIETHVCVLQTALDLIMADYEVFVVVNAVSSRSEIDYKYGLKRMKQAGVQLITTEMAFFEWITQAGTDEFKLLSKQFLQADKL